MAVISFSSNTTVHGTQNADLLLGNDSTGSNSNDIIYGLKGNDTISLINTGNALGSADVVYGNKGDDSIVASRVNDMTAYGGQGNDTIEQSLSSNSVIYGNQGNDLLEDSHFVGDNAQGFTGSSVLYGGAGDDTLVAFHVGGDTMYGGQGHDLFVANDALVGQIDSVDVPHLITVGDFLSGNDSISMSSSVSGPGNLVKEDDPTANNPAAAISDANNYYANHATSDAYVFIYGGSGAGYLFYNGDSSDSPINRASQGMILVGDNAQSSLSANDIIASPFAHG
jgi:hypothetical protein